MKTIRILLVLILGLTMSFSALAGGKRGGGHHGGKHHHGARWSVGVNVGFPGYWGGYWGGWPGYGPAYYPYYSYYPAYYPAPVVVQQQPTTYIEQPAPQAQQEAPTGYWYYCADPGAYYPYIKECPAGWQRVAPQPSN